LKGGKAVMGITGGGSISGRRARRRTVSRGGKKILGNDGGKEFKIYSRDLEWWGGGRRWL